MDKRYLDPVGRFSANDFDIRHMVTRAEYEVMKYHYHDFYEIFILIQGQLTFVLEGRTYKMTPGNILLIHYQDLHRAIPQGTGLYERFYIYIEPNYFEKRSTTSTALNRCFTTINKRRSRILFTTLEDVALFLTRFIKLSNDNSFGNDILIECCLQEFLVFINTRLANQDEELESATISENSLIRKVMDYILENLDQSLFVEEIAQHFFISRAHLSREFKKATGFTLHGYINTHKLIHSKALLIQGKKAIDVYLQCGFSNYSHFNIAFKKMFKVTPKEFQKNYKVLDNPFNKPKS